MSISISKHWFVTPGANAMFAIAAVALSLFVFAYSVRYGQLAVLMLYAIWALPVAIEPRLLLVRIPASLLVLSFGLVTAASVLWSAQPDATLRASIQYLSTLAIGIIAARVIAPRDLARGGIVGVSLILAVSVAVGNYAYDYLDTTYAFVGAFGSKNQLGWYASLGIVFALTTLIDGRSGYLWRLVAIAVAIASAAALFASESAGSILTLAAALLLATTLAIIGRVPPTERLVVVVLGILAGVLLLGVALQVGVFETVLGVFGKDSTLTGRTFLWQEGIIAAGERPFFGLGYYAYWVVSYPPAERLWEAFYITSRTGFHFHNTYIEAAVNVGLIGLATLVMVLLVYVVATLRAILLGRPEAGTILLATAGALLIMRSFVEIDFMTPYTVGTFLFAYGLTSLLAIRRTPDARPYPGRRPSLQGAEAAR